MEMERRQGRVNILKIPPSAVVQQAEEFLFFRRFQFARELNTHSAPRVRRRQPFRNSTPAKNPMIPG